MKKSAAIDAQHSLANVELAVHGRDRPLVTGLSQTEVEALLWPIQHLAGGLVASLEQPAGLLIPSAKIAPRLRRLRLLCDRAKDEAATSATGSRLGSEIDLSPLASLEIRLQALQTLEARALQAPPDSRKATGEDGTLPQAVATLAAGMGWDVAALEQDVLGYFGLPLVDPLLQHNEGPIAPQGLDEIAADLAARRLEY